MGRGVLALLAAVAKDERERLRERTRAAMEAARRRGRHVGRRGIDAEGAGDLRPAFHCNDQAPGIIELVRREFRRTATSLNSNMIGDGHPACRLKPASPAVPAASAKEDNKNDNDEKCLGIHNVQPFQCDGSAWASPQYLPFPGCTSSGEMPSSLPAPAARRHVRDVVFICPAYETQRTRRDLIEKAGREEAEFHK
jgi:hypothetical protein